MEGKGQIMSDSTGNHNTFISRITIGGREVEAVVLPIGPVNLVYARTEKGLVTCGAIDPMALDKFGIAAARVKPSGSSVANIDDLLAGIVREANLAAQALGVTVGMSGRDALAKL
jgi:uncharacterized protein YunC (DUF1805 family)